MERGKLIDLARRLRELARRGEGGEAVNAQEALDRHLTRHNLTMADLESEDREFRSIPILTDAPENHGMLLFVTLMNTAKQSECQPGVFMVLEEGKKKRVRSVGALLTPGEYAEWTAKANLYWPLLQDELQVFLRAFVGANNLWALEARERTEPLTAKEIENLRRSQNMEHSVDRRQYRRQLGS